MISHDYRLSEYINSQNVLISNGNNNVDDDDDDDDIFEKYQFKIFNAT